MHQPGLGQARVGRAELLALREQGSVEGRWSGREAEVVLGRMVGTLWYLENHKRREIMEPKPFNLLGFLLFFSEKRIQTHFSL